MSSVAGGATTKTRKEFLGRIVRVLEPAISGQGNRTDYAWNTLDKLATVEMRDQNGAVQQTRAFGYDVHGLVRSERHPEIRDLASPGLMGTTWFPEYDALGNVTQKRVGNNAQTATYRSFLNAYDAAGRLLTTDVDGVRWIESTYDVTTYAGCSGSKPLARLTKRRGFNHDAGLPNEINDEYCFEDVAGRLTKQHHVLGDIVQTWAYGSLGQPTVHAHPHLAPDPTFQTTTSYLNGFPTGVSASYASGQSKIVVLSAVYNASGGLKSYTLGNGVSATIEDDLNALARPRQVFTSGASVNFASGLYSFDGTGNVLSIGSDLFGYDKRSRLVSSSTMEGGVLQPETFSLDRAGNLFQRTQAASTIPISIDPATHRLNASNTAYDGEGNLTRFGQPATGVENFAYDALSRQMTYSVDGTGTSELYRYDAAGERITRQVPTKLIEPAPRALRFFPMVPCRLLDTRNPAGPFGAPSIAGGSSRDFVAWGTCGIPTGAESLTANVTGTDVGANGFLQAFPTALAERPAAAASALVAGKVRATLTFLRLNRQNGGFTLFGDFPAGSTTNAILDVSGYFKNVSLPTESTNSTVFFNLRDDANRLTTDYRIDYTAAGGLAAGPLLQKDYVYFGNLLVGTWAPTGPANGWRFHVSDHLGSVRLVTDDGARTVGQYKYRPYGAPLSPLQSGQGPEFAGMEKDANSLKSFVHARYYANWLGRFNSPDVVGGSPENPQTFNRFAYALGSPLTLVDPDGRATQVSYSANARIRENTAGTILRSGLPGREVAAGLSEAALSGMLPQHAGEAGEPDPFIGGPMGMASMSGRALVEAGKAGERLAGDIGLKGVRIRSFTGAKFRMPDGLKVGEALSEVKFSSYVRFTGQLKDFLRFAETSRIKFVLYVRDSATVLSKELKALVDAGRIELRTLQQTVEK